MPTPQLIDVETLLAPIPGDSPSGERLDFMDRKELDDLRTEVSADDYPEDHPMRPTEKKAEWPKVVERSKTLLTEKTKDLMIAARLVEALTKRYGFAGFRDGLQLMRRLVAEAWDRLQPPIEEPDDVQQRAKAFDWLDAADRGALFPTTVKQVPLVSTTVSGSPPYADVTGYSYNDWQVGGPGGVKVSADEFERAIRAAPAEFLQTLHEDMAQCEEEIKLTVEALAAPFGEHAPALLGIRTAFMQCKETVNGILQKRPDLSGGGEGGSAGGDGTPGSAGGRASAGSREEVYRQIGLLASQLRQMEPHSPIPYLLERAVEMGRMPFPMLVKELIRDMAQLGEVYREFGIKDAEPPPSS